MWGYNWFGCFRGTAETHLPSGALAFLFIIGGGLVNTKSMEIRWTSEKPCGCPFGFPVAPTRRGFQPKIDAPRFCLRVPCSGCHESVARSECCFGGGGGGGVDPFFLVEDKWDTTPATSKPPDDKTGVYIFLRGFWGFEGKGTPPILRVLHETASPTHEGS